MLNTTYTYEKIREVIKNKGYELDSDFVVDFPKWGKHELVNMTPEMAQKLVKHDNLLNTSILSKTEPTHVEQKIRNGTWTPDLGEVQLRPDYKVWKGMRILEAIASVKNPVDVYVNVLDSLIDVNNSDVIVTEIKNAVSTLYTEHGLELPELDDSIWKEELPSKLNKLDVMLSDTTDTLSIERPTLVAILSVDRTDKYPDGLFIIRSSNQTGEAKMYECNIAPGYYYERPLMLAPGQYKELFTVNTDNTLVQGGPVEISFPQINDDNLIEGYEKSPYQFMRVSCPLDESEGDGIIPVGIKFLSSKLEFLEDIHSGGLDGNVSLIILEEKDFL